ncbi:periodic tryptophan protein 1 homolog [Rhopilema esculentum]|uniref:periodic tryptophan protein 1 homolog n=1 Tax=Rhopilema esculentum TaxID=499914 RepID=UPI0031E29CD1
MLTCAAWVKKGIAKETPDKIELSKEDVEELMNETKQRVKDDEEKLKGTSEEEGIKNTIINDEEDDAIDEYDLENYDEEDDGEMMTGAGMAGLTYFASNEDDPYITMKNIEDEDRDDFLIKPNDNLIAIGKMEEEYCNLEIYVYNDEEGSLYVHHDILLESVPLAVEWMSYDPTSENQSGNFVAVGTMDPHIEIWDLDVVDTVESVYTLGKKPRKSKKKKKKAAATTANDGHQDAVLGLSWNRNARNVLASGSADFTVKLWDMAQCKCVHSLAHHKNKVQCLQWHPYEAQSLLTGSFDNTAHVLDCRNPESRTKSWKMDGEIERVLWDHFSPFNFMASTDQGTVYYNDVRSDSPVFQISAHNDAVTGLALSAQVSGCLVTASPDKTIKVWDYKEGKPAFVMSKDMKMGRLHFACACPDAPYTFVFGGEKDGVRVLDLLDTHAGKDHFGNRNMASKNVPDQDILPLQKETAKVEEKMDAESAENAFASLSLQGRTSNESKDIVKKKKKKNKKK